MGAQSFCCTFASALDPVTKIYTWRFGETLSSCVHPTSYGMRYPLAAGSSGRPPKKLTCDENGAQQELPPDKHVPFLEVSLLLVEISGILRLKPNIVLRLL